MTLRLPLLAALASVLALSVLATPAAANPIVPAPFSRTANSLASDGIAPALAPLQSVNSFDRTGLVETLLTDGNISLGNYAQAYSFVQFGVIRVIANTQGADSVNKSATASGSFQDTLAISGSGISGAAYRFVGSFSITGTQSALANAPGGLSTTNAAYHWSANQHDASVGGDLESFTTSSNGFLTGVNFLGSTIPVDFLFVWGDPVIFEVDLGAGPTSFGNGQFAAASQDMGHSLIWQGASIFAPTTGSPVSASIGSASGTDWGASAAEVPEPSTLTLMGLGLASFVRRAALRRRSVSKR